MQVLEEIQPAVRSIKATQQTIGITKFELFRTVGTGNTYKLTAKGDQ